MKHKTSIKYIVKLVLATSIVYNVLGAMYCVMVYGRAPDRFSCITTADWEI